MRSRVLLLLYFANAVVALGAMGGLYVVWNSASLPFSVYADAGCIRASSTAEVRSFGMTAGDSILAVNGQSVHAEDELRFLLNSQLPGSVIRLTSSSPQSAQALTHTVPLVRTYSTLSLLVRGFAGLLYMLFGLLILIRRPNEITARIVNAVALAAGIIVLDTWGYYVAPVAGALYGYVFFFAYGLVPVLLLHFGLLFPKPLFKNRSVLLVMLYMVMLGLAAWESVLFGSAVHFGSLREFDRFASLLNVSEWLFGVITLAAFGAFCITYSRSTEQSERKKVRWVLVGISFSSLFFFFFEELPQLLGIPFIVSEEVVLLASTVAPVTFAIAIIRYQVLDIDALLNRATVYLAVGAALFGLYAALLIVATSLVGEISPTGNLALSSSVAILTALLFEPLRQHVQRFVDRTFFRVRYNYREVQKEILAELAEVRTAEALARLLVVSVDKLLKSEWSSVAIFPRAWRERGISEAQDGAEGSEAERPFILTVGSAPRGSDVERTLTASFGMAPHGDASVIEPGAHFVPFAEALRHPLREARLNTALLVALLSEHGEQLGALALGPKRSGQRLSIEDVDLIETVARSAGLAIERSLLSEQLIEEQTEAKRQKQLNALKSQLVSSVSHDLKTPITSIKLFVQLLEQTRATLSPSEMEYLRIIDGESDRLKTLIDNVLDHARIERGAMEYHLAPCELNACVLDALAPLKYLIDMQGFALSLELSDSALPIEADATALHTSITNILSNGIKYGIGNNGSGQGSGRRIVVRTFSGAATSLDSGANAPLQNVGACLEIRDFGIGIPERDLERLFEPYFRSSDHAKTLKTPGTGLGLANVKHAIDAHHGLITVQSSVGQGTSVTICLPLGANPQR